MKCNRTAVGGNPDLPEGPFTRNAGQRASRAQRALDAYLDGDILDESNIRDCICDLLHLAHKHGKDPVWEANMAIGCWREESRNE